MKSATEITQMPIPESSPRKAPTLLGHFSLIGVVMSPMLDINKLVAMSKSERTTLCHGGPGYVLDANVMIAGKLNPANTGATSSVYL